MSFALVFRLVLYLTEQDPHITILLYAFPCMLDKVAMLQNKFWQNLLFVIKVIKFEKHAQHHTLHAVFAKILVMGSKEIRHFSTWTMGSKLRAPRNLILTKKINVTIWLITSKPIYLDKCCKFLNRESFLSDMSRNNCP